MATHPKTVRMRNGRVKAVKQLMQPHFRVRKGWRYVLCQCVGCSKLFQVPYKEPGFSFAVERLYEHKEACQEL